MNPNNTTEPEVYFKSIETRILESIQYANNKRYRYLILFAFILLVIFLLLLNIDFGCIALDDEKIMSLSVPAGLLGTLLSLMQRKKEISMTKYVNKRQILLVAFISLLTGALSGMITYVIIESKLVFGEYDFEDEVIFLFCFLSGFSERYFNSLLTKAEAANTKKPTANTTTPTAT